jgi:hypothetical protein
MRARLQPLLHRIAGLTAGLQLSGGVERRVAELGAWGAAIIGVWGLYKLGHWPTNVPVLQSYRLGFYWNDQRDRWLLLFLPGICGLIGLFRLARRGQSFSLWWFLGLYIVGAIGAAVHLATGYQLPLYYRFILLCELPVAVGVGAFIAHHRSGVAALILAATVIGSFAYKAVTLATVPDNLSYFGARLSTLYTFGGVTPAGTGIVASDPNTSYFIPLITGSRVLTVGMGHADSGTEPADAEAGYELLRTVFAGSDSQAAAALRRMWNGGVRWVIVEKYTTLEPATEKALFGGPYNALIAGPDINRLAT